MDVDSLEQLLNCPVCFERFDGTNRVLPCQHTFCKKCLNAVKSRFNELKCPECRSKYDGYINDLPCNIFVIRVLEQIRQREAISHSNSYSSDLSCSNSKSNKEERELGKVGSSSVRLLPQESNKDSPNSLAPENPVGHSNQSNWLAGRSRSRSCDQEVPAVTLLNDNIAGLSSSEFGRPLIRASRLVNNNPSSSTSFSNPLSEFFDLRLNDREILSNRLASSEAFGQNDYKFSVELKSDKRNPNSLRRTKRNNQSNYLVSRRPIASSPALLQEPTSTNELEKTIHVFNPENYSFSVELKSDARSIANPRRQRRTSASVVKPPKWL